MRHFSVELWSDQSAILYKHALTADAYGNSINGKPYFCKSNFMSSALKETLYKIKGKFGEWKLRD